MDSVKSDNFEMIYNYAELEIYIIMQNESFTMSEQDLCSAVISPWDLFDCKRVDNKFTI